MDTQEQLKIKGYTAQELMNISENMIAYGGSFFTAIGTALRVADRQNTIKILEAWPDEIKSYSKY